METCSMEAESLEKRRATTHQEAGKAVGAAAIHSDRVGEMFEVSRHSPTPNPPFAPPLAKTLQYTARFLLLCSSSVRSTHFLRNIFFIICFIIWFFSLFRNYAVHFCVMYNVRIR